MTTLSSIFPGKSLGQRCLVGYSPRGCKESNWATNTTTKPRPRATNSAPPVTDPAFLISSRVKPILPAGGPSFEKHGYMSPAQKRKRGSDTRLSLQQGLTGP